MSRVVFMEERCKGCRLCVEVCPKKIVFLDKSVLNGKGYHPATVTDMESCIGCVGRDLRNRNALRTILDAAERLKTYPDETVSALAGEIIEAAQDFEE